MSPSDSDAGRLLQALMDSTTDSIYFKDAESRLVMVNQACARKHGLTPEQCIGKTDFDLFAKEHAEQAYADEQRIIATGEPIEALEEKETWADGRVTWASTTKMPLRDESGRIIGTFGVSRDITNHKQATLQAARYAKEVRKIKEAMEEDVGMAGELQKTFFPRSYPLFPEDAPPGGGCVEFLHHFTLERPVSGDYCSIKKLSPTEAGVLLCDARGVGARAALVTALIRGVAQELHPLERDPAAYLSRMGQMLHPLLHKDGSLLEVTACYLVLDVAAGSVRLACAGHPVPILFHPGEPPRRIFENLVFRGPALATDWGVRYRAIQRRIEPGDSVVLYSSGLIGFSDRHGYAYGEQRLLSDAANFSGEPLAEIFRGLQEDALAVSQHGRFDDDLCIVGFNFRHAMERP